VPAVERPPANINAFYGQGGRVIAAVPRIAKQRLVSRRRQRKMLWFDQGGEAETGGMRRNTPDLFQTASLR
jgi:hypothetical protein